MSANLRPMTLGEILDRTFQIYWQRFGLFLLLAAFPIFRIALSVFYYDQRIRHGGFDIEMMMSAAGMKASADGAPDVSPAALVESGEPSA
jgi:hypothetical protein